MSFNERLNSKSKFGGDVYKMRGRGWLAGEAADGLFKRVVGKGAQNTNGSVARGACLTNDTPPSQLAL